MIRVFLVASSTILAKTNQRQKGKLRSQPKDWREGKSCFSLGFRADVPGLWVVGMYGAHSGEGKEESVFWEQVGS